MDLSGLLNNKHALANIGFCLATTSSAVYYKAKLSEDNEENRHKKNMLALALIVITLSMIGFFIYTGGKDTGKKSGMLFLINLVVVIFLLTNLYKPSCKSNDGTNDKSIMISSEWQLIIFSGFLLILSFVLPIYNEKINTFAETAMSETSDKILNFKETVSSKLKNLKGIYPFKSNNMPGVKINTSNNLTSNTSSNVTSNISS